MVLICQKLTRLNWSSSGYFWPLIVRILSSGKSPRVGHCKSWLFHTFNGIVVIGSFLFFVLAMGCGYSYMFPNPSPSVQPIIRDYEIRQTPNSIVECNFFEGRWVYDESYPLYNASQCPFAERGFNCLANGRRDKGYLNWKWKPKKCDIPKFDIRLILENLRGKRVVFVGDSLGRTQWESMICLLMTGVDDKNGVYEVNNHKITKLIRYLGVRFESFNFTVEFYRSVFLVQPGSKPKRAPKRVKSMLKLDKLDDISREWIDSDILVFNTGHWWTPSKLFEMGRYFQVGGKMKLGMSMNAAYRTALATWASWVENTINTNRTHVLFRTFEPSHWSGRNGQTCKVTRQPLSESKGWERSPFSDIILKMAKNIAVPITVMHVTPMGAFRSDAHVGTWSDNPSVPDCSHWCLPGVPDVWNEILFSHLLLQDQVTH